VKYQKTVETVLLKISKIEEYLRGLCGDTAASSASHLVTVGDIIIMAGKGKNIAGVRFARLTAIAPTSFRKGSSIVWVCTCDCGNSVEATVSSLSSGDKKTCGKCAFRTEKTVERNKKRTGFRKENSAKRNKSYEVWCGMLARCRNPNKKAFKHYGGRGISVCERWQSSFEAFLEDMGERPEGMTIERIDNNGDYEPENCKWASPSEQARNKRSTVRITAEGRTQCLSDWAKEKGLNPTSITERLDRGWTEEEAVATPARPPAFSKIKYLTFQGKTQSVSEWSRETGIGHTTLFARLKRGWSVDLVLSPLRVK
jgi:hypothetical protein